MDHLGESGIFRPSRAISSATGGYTTETLGYGVVRPGAGPNSMDYRIESAWIPRFGRVEKILIEPGSVGMVFRNPEPSAEAPHLWVGYDRRGHAADSREDAIQLVVEHAEAHPAFALA